MSGSAPLKRGTLNLATGRLAYAESAGVGPGVLLIHGNSGSGEVWAAQLDSELGRRYRLVALDLPSHGESAPLAASEDTLAEMAHVVATAAVALELAGGVVVGHSLGGHLLLEALGAGHLPDLRGAVIHGAPPLSGPADFPHAFHASPAAMSGFTAAPTEQALDALLEAWFAGRCPPPGIKRDFLRTHGPIRAQLGAALMSGRMLDERKVVAELKVPLALLNAGDDALINAAWLSALDAPTLWRGQVQVVANAAHFIQCDQPDAYNRVLGDFLADVFGA